MYLAIFNLGIESAEGIITDLIPRNSTLPTKKTKLFTTYTDYLS